MLGQQPDSSSSSMKQKQRYRHKTKGFGLCTAWPQDSTPQIVASLARYVGSGEHKALPIDDSYLLEPAAYKRSDASRCDPAITRDQAEEALRTAIQRGHVSADFQGGLPVYVWGRLDGRPYTARLINREAGHYKAWPVEESELPLDRDGQLVPRPDDA
jgi:hypothetical protein